MCRLSSAQTSLSILDTLPAPATLARTINHGLASRDGQTARLNLIRERNIHQRVSGASVRPANWKLCNVTQPRDNVLPAEGTPPLALFSYRSLLCRLPSPPWFFASRVIKDVINLADDVSLSSSHGFFRRFTLKNGPPYQWFN